MTNKNLQNIVYQQYLEYLRSTGRIDLKKLKRSYEAVYFWMQDHLKKELPENKDSEILVIGCGPGHEVYALNKMGYKNVLGCDISEEQIKIAKFNKLKVIKADAFDLLKNIDKKFDVIIAFGLIEHFKIEKAFELLEVCHAALNDNGIIILRTPNANNIFALKMIYGDITHKVAFNETSLTQLLIAAKFKELKFQNVKTFGKLDDKITLRIMKFLMTIVINLTWKLIRLFYWLNGIKPPKVVSPDLLAIACKK